MKNLTTKKNSFAILDTLRGKLHERELLEEIGDEEIGVGEMVAAVKKRFLLRDGDK